MKTILRSIILSNLFVTISFANIINVPVDIDSIQGGINMAVDGDTVLVQPGTYVENINFNGKNIVVGSLTLTTGDTSYISQTVIDADSIDSVIKFENGEDSTTVLCGFTLKNGGLRRYGGGILMMNSSPLVSNMLIKNNEAVYGGGICLNNSKSNISNTTIISNLASQEVFMFDVGYGGGIFCDSSNLTLTNVKIMKNVSIKGGGIFCTNSNIVLEYVTVSENNTTNQADGTSGGGIEIHNSSAKFENMKVTKNHTKSSGGGINCLNSNPLFSNVSVFGNTAGWGGGIFFDGNSYANFDSTNRCNIYLNNTISEEIGQDLYSLNNSVISVFLDTFTVMNPDSFHAYPLNKFTFDIQNTIISNLSENRVSPNKFALNQNYPNPFNSNTTIEFTIPKTEFVTLKIYNLLGQEVTTVVSEKLTPGNYKYTWDASRLASGLYVYRIKAGAFQQIKKMVLLK